MKQILMPLTTYEFIADIIMECSVVIIGTIAMLFLHLNLTSSNNEQREGKDLIYEAMKMRTGNWKSWDPNRVQIVGGGILEKKMLGERGDGVEELETPRHESRGMYFLFDHELRREVSQAIYFFYIFFDVF